MRDSRAAVVTTFLGIAAIAVVAWLVEGSVPVGGSLAASLGLGVLAGVVGVVAQLVLVAVVHRRSLAELVRRNRRTGGG